MAAIPPSDPRIVGVKDNMAVQGHRVGNGLGRPGPVAPRDAPIVARLRAAGYRILPNQPMDEAAFGATGDNPHHGRTENPAAPGHSPGGSSAGGAAAVAAHQVHAALGTDTLGSVRIPAAYCGIIGLKPSRNLLPMEGIAPLSPSLDHPGLLARTLDDLGELLFSLGGRAGGGDPLQTPTPTRYRVLVPGTPEPTTPETRSAFDAAIARMRAQGWTITQGAIPDWDPEPHRRAALLLIEAEAAITHQALLASDDPALSPATRHAFRYGRNAPASRLLAAIHTLRRVEQGLAQVFTGHDLVATPTTPAPAYPWTEPPPPGQALFTALANWSGLPAISVPVPTAGRPIGLQLMAPWGHDALLMDAAASLLAPATPNSRP